jgi:S1-C subfamily serine protease
MDGTEPCGRAARHQSTNEPSRLCNEASRTGRWRRLRAAVAPPLGASAALVIAGALALGACGGAAPEKAATPAPPAKPKPPSPQEIRDRAAQSTVRIWGKEPEPFGRKGGTGVYLGSGDILTNNHVTAGMAEIHVVYKGDEVSATVKASNVCQDYAIVHVDNPPQGLLPAPLGSSEQLEVGQHVTAFGFGSSALNGGQSHHLLMKPGSVSATGLKSSFDPNLPKYRDLIEFDAQIREGMSGGGVWNDSGQVVGVSTLGNNETGEHYAIAIDQVKQDLPALQAGKSPAATGMELLSVSRAAYYEVTGQWWPWKSALYVLGVESGSAADNAKPWPIADGDVLTELEGERIRSVGDYCSIVQSHEKGDTLKAYGWTVTDDGPLPWTREIRLRLK